jgi:hypothetical protein
VFGPIETAWGLGFGALGQVFNLGNLGRLGHLGFGVLGFYMVLFGLFFDLQINVEKMHS